MKNKQACQIVFLVKLAVFFIPLFFFFLVSRTAAGRVCRISCAFAAECWRRLSEGWSGTYSVRWVSLTRLVGFALCELQRFKVLFSCDDKRVYIFLLFFVFVSDAKKMEPKKEMANTAVYSTYSIGSSTLQQGDSSSRVCFLMIINDYRRWP